MPCLRSGTMAAAVLHMSQPALSHQIAAVERELGTPVIKRLARGTRPTAAGLAAAAEARIALAAADRAVLAARRVATGTHPTLRTGIIRPFDPPETRDVVVVAAAPHDDLLLRFVSDLKRRGLPDWRAARHNGNAGITDFDKAH